MVHFSSSGMSMRHGTSNRFELPSGAVAVTCSVLRGASESSTRAMSKVSKPVRPMDRIGPLYQFRPYSRVVRCIMRLIQGVSSPPVSGFSSGTP